MPPDAPAPTAAAPATPTNGAAAEPAPAAKAGEAVPAPKPVVIDAPQPKQPRIAPHFVRLREEERRIREREAKVAEVEALKALREKDPWEFAQKLGFSARDVAKRAVDEGKKTPEAVALEAAQAKVAELEKRLDKRDENEKTQAEKDARAADVAAVGRALAAAPGEFLALEGETPEDVADAFEAIYLRDYEPLGEALTVENVRAIFAVLDGNLRRFYESKAGRLKPPDRAPEAVQPAKPETKARKHVLSNLDAAERVSGKEPKRPSSREERLARAVAARR